MQNVDAVFGVDGHALLLHRGAESILARDHGDLGEAALLEILEDLLTRHQVGMRRLEDIGLGRRHGLHRAGEIDEGHLGFFRQRDDGHGGGGGRSGEQRIDAVLLDQAGAESARLVRIAGIVIDDQVDLLAVDATLGVDIGDVHFQRLLFRIAEERGGSGDRKHRADLDVGVRGAGGHHKCGGGQEFRQTVSQVCRHVSLPW